MINSPLPNAQYRRFESFREYDALFDEWIPRTQNIIRVFDRALPKSWNSPERDNLLRQFLRADPLNRLHVVVHEPGTIERELPRMIELARDFGHAFRLRQTPKEERHLYDPFIVFDASHYLHRFHHAHMRAAIGTHDVEGARQLLERHIELWEVSQVVNLSTLSGL
jgi:hypothetical protein